MSWGRVEKDWRPLKTVRTSRFKALLSIPGTGGRWVRGQRNWLRVQRSPLHSTDANEFRTRRSSAVRHNAPWAPELDQFETTREHPDSPQSPCGARRLAARFIGRRWGCDCCATRFALEPEVGEPLVELGSRSNVVAVQDCLTDAMTDVRCVAAPGFRILEFNRPGPAAALVGQERIEEVRAAPDHPTMLGTAQHVRRRRRRPASAALRGQVAHSTARHKGFQSVLRRHVLEHRAPGCVSSVHSSMSVATRSTASPSVRPSNERPSPRIWAPEAPATGLPRCPGVEAAKLGHLHARSRDHPHESAMGGRIELTTAADRARAPGA